MGRLPEIFFQKTIWDSEKNPVVVGTTLRLYRNFSLYKFPGKMSLAEMNGSLKTLLETCQKIPSLAPLTHVLAEELSPLEKELLFEHFHCAQSFQEAQAGQGFAFDAQGKYLLTFHIHNHLQLHTVDPSLDLGAAWFSLLQIDQGIGKTHPYAFSPRFGYLTADPRTCGTALEARLILHVPALRHTGTLGNFLHEQRDEQITFSSLEGSMDDLVGDFLILKNHYTLGIAEETLLSLLQATALKMIDAEKAARKELKSKPSPELKDFVGRSFGLLMHSYQLHPREALDGLSGLKLGLDLGWVSGVTSQKLTILISQLRRGHLTHLLGLASSDPQELSHKRAEWLHQELKDMSLAD